MHLWSLPALVLTVTFEYLTHAAPIAESQLLPRNHVQCSSAFLCQIQQTCDNAPSIVAGTVPEPWPSSVTQWVNPVTVVAPLTDEASEASEASEAASSRKRQASLSRWCALGTEIYITLAVQGTQSAAAVQSTLKKAVTNVEYRLSSQPLNKSASAIAAGAAPVYNLTETDSQLIANNAMGANMTWLELELGLLTMQDWMGKHSYGWGSASVYNGTNKVGIIYIMV